jgi:hypothetical protein
MCTNEVTYDLFKSLCGGNKVQYVEHPTDVVGLRQLLLDGKTKIDEKLLSCSVNPETGSTMPVLLINTHKRNRGKDGIPDIYSPYVAVGMGEQRLPYLTYISNIPGDKMDLVAPLFGTFTLPDDIPIKKFWDFMIRSFAAVDFYTSSSYGRFTTETGALGVPTVCSKHTDSGRKIFPELAVDMRYPSQIHEKLKNLLFDLSFRNHVIEVASKNVEQYDYPTSKKKFLRMCREAELFPSSDIYLG